MWEVIVNVTTTLALAAFVVAAVVSVINKHMANQLDAIEKADAKDRPMLVKKLLGDDIDLDTRNLSKEQIHDLAAKKINLMNTRMRHKASIFYATMVIVAILVIVLSYFYIIDNKGGVKTEMNENPGTSVKTAEPSATENPATPAKSSAIKNKGTGVPNMTTSSQSGINNAKVAFELCDKELGDLKRIYDGLNNLNTARSFMTSLNACWKKNSFEEILKKNRIYLCVESKASPQAIQLAKTKYNEPKLAFTYLKQQAYYGLEIRRADELKSFFSKSAVDEKVEEDDGVIRVRTQLGRTFTMEPGIPYGNDHIFTEKIADFDIPVYIVLYECIIK